MVLTKSYLSKNIFVYIQNVLVWMLAVCLHFKTFSFFFSTYAYSRVSNKHPGHLSLMGFFLPLKGQLQILDY